MVAASFEAVPAGYMFLLIIFIINIFCAWFGAHLAEKRGRDTTLWAVLCFLLGVIGVALIAMVDEKREETPARQTAPSPNAGPKLIAASVKGYDVKKWQTLKEVDTEIQFASETARLLGEVYEDELAEKYLALNDKAYLGVLVEKLQKKASEAATQQAERAAREAELIAAETDKRKIAARIFQDRFPKEVEENGGRDPLSQKIITKLVPTSGRYESSRGGFKIVFADGSAAIRTAGSNMNFISEQEAEDWGA